MTGRVDDSGRALLPIRLKHPIEANDATFDAWIDTGFTGDLVLPKDAIESLELPVGGSVIGRLANGQDVELQTYVCVLEWFGRSREIEVIGNEGAHPLLGVGLLKGRDLCINYRARHVGVS